MSVNKTQNDAMVRDKQSFIMNLSISQSVICKLTSFVAIERRDKNECVRNGVTDIASIIALHNVDTLLYMASGMMLLDFMLLDFIFICRHLI